MVYGPPIGSLRTEVDRVGSQKMAVLTTGLEIHRYGSFITKLLLL